MKLPVLPIVLCLAGCATVSPGSTVRDPYPQASTKPLNIERYPQYGTPAPPKPPGGRPVWNEGQAVLQGFLGATFYDKITREGGDTADVDGDAGDLDQLPLIGGGGQWKLGGDRTDFGLEAFFSLEGRANTEAFIVSGGGAAVAVDVDLLIVDLYGGPFVSRFLGDKVRVYGGLGPLLQFASYDQDLNTSHDDGSGFGVGGYVRAGFEYILPSRTMLGLGALWLHSNVDLNSDLGDLETEGYQVFLTLSRGL